jgi:hypothetical protein
MTNSDCFSYQPQATSMVAGKDDGSRALEKMINEKKAGYSE